MSEFIDLLVFPANLENEFSADEKVGSVWGGGRADARRCFYFCPRIVGKPAADGRVLPGAEAEVSTGLSCWLPAASTVLLHTSLGERGRGTHVCAVSVTPLGTSIRRCNSPDGVLGRACWLGEKVLMRGVVCLLFLPPCLEPSPCHPTLPARLAGQGGAGLNRGRLLSVLSAEQLSLARSVGKGLVKTSFEASSPASWSRMQNTLVLLFLLSPVLTCSPLPVATSLSPPLSVETMDGDYIFLSTTLPILRTLLPLASRPNNRSCHPT